MRKSYNVKNPQKQKVRRIMTELENFRTQEAISRNYTITKLYNEFFYEPSSNLFKLHQKLDKAVCACYGWKYSHTKSYNDEMLALNIEKTKLN
ncbi:MAG: hypothetical protein IMF12_10205 [Proteobacteria bacterium]|nr:hypothetical protein [Pseudomonadota bacterium]